MRRPTRSCPAVTSEARSDASSCPRRPTIPTHEHLDRGAIVATGVEEVGPSRNRFHQGDAIRDVERGPCAPIIGRHRGPGRPGRHHALVVLAPPG